MTQNALVYLSLTKHGVKRLEQRVKLQLSNKNTLLDMFGIRDILILFTILSLFQIHLVASYYSNKKIMILMHTLISLATMK